MDAIAVEAAGAATGDVRTLIDELDRTLEEHYLPEQRHGLAVEEIFASHVRFFIARQNGVACGCGGLALFETFGEAKRMYVRENVRGRGVARALLSRIESEARAKGRDLLRLETGDRQSAAIRLYEGGRIRTLRLRRIRFARARGGRDERLLRKATDDGADRNRPSGAAEGRSRRSLAFHGEQRLIAQSLACQGASASEHGTAIRGM